MITNSKLNLAVASIKTLTGKTSLGKNEANAIVKVITTLANEIDRLEKEIAKLKD
jgi:hypothetical protein